MTSTSWTSTDGMAIDGPGLALRIRGRLNGSENDENIPYAMNCQLLSVELKSSKLIPYTDSGCFSCL